MGKKRQLRLEEEHISRVQANEELNAKASLTVKQVKGEVSALLSLTKQPEDSLLAEEKGLLKKREEALTREKAARLARIKQLEEEEEESLRLEDEFKKKKAMFLPPPSVSPSTVKKNPPPPPASRGKVPPPPPASPSLYQVPPVQSSSTKAPIPSEPISYPPTIDVEYSDPPAVVLPTAVPPLPPPPPPAAPAPLPGLLSASTNPFHRLGSLNNSSASTTPATSFPSKLSPNNEWDAKEKDDEDDDSNEEGATTARQACQGLAEALFGGGVPSRLKLAAPGASASAPPAPPPVPPHAPSAPKSPIASDSGAPADCGMLLGAIRGGALLRKVQTNNCSLSSVAGKVIGSSSPPPQSIGDSSALDQRSSVDWIGGMAADGLRPTSFQDSGHQSPLPTHAEESPKRPAEEVGLGDEKVEDVTSSFDMKRTIRVRTLYAYKSQFPEDLSLVENIVIEAHPSKTDNDWLCGTDVKSGRTGTFPKAYVTELEVTWGKVLYGYTASSANEVSLIEDEMLLWWIPQTLTGSRSRNREGLGWPLVHTLSLAVSWKDPVGGLSLIEKFLANLLPSPCQVTPFKVDHPPMRLIKCYVSPSS
ncbi:hypothetical protein PPACK8108_LOCUS9379 [Phakopsora pachyrhizi]|uniref:SH3 domain-containing protein n=1 Tax=Phakopsora pachyrhizi TaxID=170000 RepID=A0AAV0AWD8_PHAPC|nr:hypothetical protein PPACK8108_LOCUS9379 [Phakopsora pachyrhizi]